MAKREDYRSKIEWLRENGTLNRGAHDVKDEFFLEYDFFDPCDLLQVKYEMVRRVERDDWTVSQASKMFGFSRTSFYQTQRTIDEEGLGGLGPRKRGPKAAHKLTEDVMQFVEESISEDSTLRAPKVAELVEEHFGFTVHPRSIERALERRKKNQRRADEKG